MTGRFPLGTVVATPGACAGLERAGDHPATLIRRHISGDWGELDADDCAENERSLQTGLPAPLCIYALGRHPRLGDHGGGSILNMHPPAGGILMLPCPSSRSAPPPTAFLFPVCLPGAKGYLVDRNGLGGLVGGKEKAVVPHPPAEDPFPFGALERFYVSGERVLDHLSHGPCDAFFGLPSARL